MRRLTPRSGHAGAVVGILLVGIGLIGATYVALRIGHELVRLRMGIDVNGALIAGVVLGVCAPVAGWSLLARWPPSRSLDEIQWVTILATLAALGGVALLAARQGLGLLDVQGRLGIPTAHIAVSLALAGAACGAAAAIVAVVRWPVPRVAGTAVAVVAAVAAAVGLGSAATVAATRPTCASFHFDRQAWADARHAREERFVASPAKPMAEAIVRCDTLTGKTAAEVRRLLGPPERGGISQGGRRWRYVVAQDLVGIFTIETTTLMVRFGPDGRAVTATTNVEIFRD